MMSLVTSAATNKFQTFHVNGSMPTARRERELRDFRAAARAVVSNARCLTEGVDVPAVDMVAFLSPRRRRVDIVQATGRAMRRSPGKTTGYVLVPLYVELTAGECAKRRGVRQPSGALGGRDAENGHRDGRAPRQCPSWWPCASTGQWQFGVDERGKGRLNLQPQMDTDKHGFFQARQGWHICSIAILQGTKLRQERHHRTCGRKMPPRWG